jgi:predicted TPR repeat methyltransferase
VCQRRATELAPDNATVWYRLGELAHIVGRRDEARTAYERYFEQHPDDPEIEHILIALRDGQPPGRASDRYIEKLYTRFASYYDESMCETLQYKGPALLHDALTAVLGNRGGLNVLDLGCGTGLSGQMLRPLARRLTGVDLSTSMIERARARGVYDDLHAAEMTAFLQIAPDEPFDVIAACEALIYFGDLRQVIAPAARLLSPDGLVAFTVERGDVDPFRLTDSGRFAHHRNHVCASAEDAGLTVARIDEGTLRYEYGNPVPGLMVVLRRILSTALS